MNCEFTVEKWDNRHWALFEGEDLICVTVYKKGALEVKRRLEQRGFQETLFPATPNSSELTPTLHLSCLS